MDEFLIFKYFICRTEEKQRRRQRWCSPGQESSARIATNGQPSFSPSTTEESRTERSNRHRKNSSIFLFFYSFSVFIFIPSSRIPIPIHYIRSVRSRRLLCFLPRPVCPSKLQTKPSTHCSTVYFHHISVFVHISIIFLRLFSFCLLLMLWCGVLRL